MLAEADLEEYLKEMREQVCACCVERPPEGPPCGPLGKQCGVEMHLAALIDSVHEVQSASMGPYLDNNRRKICEHCPLLHESECPCPMDYLAVLVVQAIETVDERRKERPPRELPVLLSADEEDASIDAISRAYVEAAGVWVGCDWPTQFGNTKLNLQGWKAEEAEAMARVNFVTEEAEDWRAAAVWLAKVEKAAYDAEEQATLAVAAACSGRWGPALEHARKARNIEFSLGRPVRGKPFLWQPLLQVIETAARAHGLEGG
jgi:hypothetical protein